MPQYEEELRRDIVLIKRQHDQGASFRWLAEEWKMPLSRVYRLYKLWRPDLDREDDFAWEEEEDESEAPAEADGYILDTDLDDDDLDAATTQSFEADTADAELQRPATAGGADSSDLDRSLLVGDWPAWLLKPGLEPDITDHGKEILVETRDERGKPKVWYSLTSKGAVRRHVHDGWGVNITRAQPPTAAD